MADYGIKVSKVGYDVKTAAIENLSLHSEKQNYLIRTEGYVAQSVTSGSPQSVFAGGTFYKDVMFLGFLEVDGNGKWYQPYVTETSSGGGGTLDLYIDTDKTQAVYGDISMTSGTHDTKTYFFILFNQQTS